MIEIKDMTDITDIFAGKTILVAEDIIINREILGILLEETGISIDYAENGKVALDLFISNPDKYDLILTDINMPEIDGYQIARILRATDGRGKDIPIIALTANHYNENIDSFPQAGINDFISKPVDINMLVAILNKWMNK